MQNEKTKKTKSARKLLIAAVCAAVLVVAMSGGLIVWNIFSDGQLDNATVLQNSNDTLILHGQVLKIERATTEAQRNRGLCCREYLAPNSGMLFIYDTPGNYRFWMKDTRIPLDMYWISNEKKIVHIEKSVQPTSYPESFGTDIPAQYILETNAGYAEKHDIQIGDSVGF